MNEIKEIASFVKAGLQRRKQIILNFKIFDIKELKDMLTVKISVQADGQIFLIVYDLRKEEAYKIEPIGYCIGQIIQELNEEKGKKYKYDVRKNSITISRFLEAVK